jgi:hypothetical protein
VEAVVDRPTEAQQELEEALDERDIAQGRFEAAIGTSAEMGAYQRLRRAARRVSVADRVARSKTSP